MLLQVKTSLFVLFNATAESVNCSLFLKNLETHFCNVTCKKKFVKRIENLSQRLSEKFIDYQYPFEKLSLLIIRMAVIDVSL